MAKRALGFDTGFNSGYITVNRCEVNLAPANSLPSVALASHRGCGNTWMRHLIEQTTGIYSGSLGNSSFMLENGFLGELESRTSGRTVVTKTHGINFKKINMFDKVILIFRNPYRCFLAEFNRQQTGSKTERALATSFNSKAWQSFIHRQFSRWEVFAKNWLTSNLPKLVVHYEDLEDNLIHELRRISRFLNVTSFESRLSCVMKNTEGRFHRTT
uniref:WSC domain-containing protein 1-like n=1 Tax=Saccoglossus kowalevskii TaxID=10224 RepID=A0ABM0LZT0_SACKO